MQTTPPRRAAIALIVLALLAGAAWWAWPNPEPDAPPAPPLPSTYQDPEWERLLAGDTAKTAETYTQLNAYHPGLTARTAQQVADTATQVLVADLTGRGRDTWPRYWPPAATTTTRPGVRCTAVNVEAISTTPLPTTDPVQDNQWVKSLVAYTGTCGKTRYTRAAPGVEYIYGVLPGNGAGYQPRREWDVPAEPEKVDGGPGDLADWQLTALTACASGTGEPQRLRTYPAAAADKMCTDAKNDGVVLVVDSAYRTRTDQARLFQEAVDYYGSPAKARAWVAHADATTCDSKHCAGTALNFEPDNAALTWLNTIVACTTAAGTRNSADGTCDQGATKVRRAQTYGFVLPYDRIPGYAEFALPLDDATATIPNCQPAGVGVDMMVAAIFRCRLGRANVPPVVIEQTVAEALVVSRCASGWNASARVYAGRYATSPEPATGRLFTEAGVFALRAELAETGWLPGDVHDPVDNINAAASLWLATRGWEQFPCATGTDPGFNAGPVLPGYGGPALPDWAKKY